MHGGNPALVQVAGVEDVVDPLPVPGIVKDRVLEAGGSDGLEV